MYETEMQKWKWLFPWLHRTFRRTRNRVPGVLSLCFTHKLLCCPLPPHTSFPRKERQGNFSSFKNTCGFHWNAKQSVILKITLYYLTCHSILVFLCFFSCNKLVLYSEYICTYKNTCLYPKCTWKQQRWFLMLRQQLQILCDQSVTYTETGVSLGPSLE